VVAGNGLNQLRILCYPSVGLLMTHHVKRPLDVVVTCPYCSAKLFWFPALDEGLVARQNCPRCKSRILIIDNVAHFDTSAKKAPQRAL
jgi:DNA-directed RNA polymerase subunit RPC12/RpoP